MITHCSSLFRFGGFLALLLLAPQAAVAQTDFTNLHATLGDKIHVVHPNGVEVSGHLTELSPGHLAIDGYHFEPEPGLKIQKSGDSVIEGTLIGAGVGMLIVAPVCRMNSCIVSAATIYGLLGAAIDWAHVGRRTLFQINSQSAGGRSIDLVPVVTRERKGVGISLSF